MKNNAAKGYEKTKPKQTQFPQRVKLIQSVYLQRIMEINVDMGSEKTNPIKSCPERSEFTLSVIEGNGPILPQF
jgi:hypothetical protein